MEIKGHAAIITGGASGMGAATAAALIKQGAKVAILDINEEALKTVANEIGALPIPVDVTSEQSVESALKAAEQAHGPARICVNCAGIAPGKRVVGRDGPMPLDDFKKAIDINLIGSFNVLRLAAASMSQTEAVGDSGERGVIINTASIAAYEGQIGQAAYSASKGGIVSMTLPIARELAQFGIRVLTVAPGIMDTPMMAAMSDEIRESLAQQIPFPKRFGRADEYASLVEQIITNTMLNACVIRLDGGIRMGAK